MNTCFIAHRGYSGRFQQNTEESFLEAVKHGSGGIETDVRFTKDGVLIVNHNDTVEYFDGTELVPEESTYEELIKKPIKNEHTDTELYVCTFERYLEICRDGNMICFIEFKGNFTDEMINKAFTMAGEIYDLKMCSLQSFEYDNLIRTRKAFPELQIMYTCGERDANVERCLEDGFDIDMYYGNVDEKTIKEFHDKGLKVALWTANTEEAIKYCYSLNVDYIESDYFANEKCE